ncbi:MAG: hypothetical protein H7A20_01970 [Rhodanobacteraceae bacterium]|nr:hypothetical protein [Rhodanobacteraceae bacterium]
MRRRRLYLSRQRRKRGLRHGQVTLNIDCLNRAPVAAATLLRQRGRTVQRRAAVVGVLANDSDANGDELTAVLDDDVQHGSLTLNADGSFITRRTPASAVATASPTTPMTAQPTRTWRR